MKKSRINQVSKKERVNKKKLAEVYEEIDGEREHICSGCGQNQMLSHSHLIPRSRRKDLEAEKENIMYDCMQRINGSEGCHSRWESMDWSKMNTLIDFEERIEYIKNVDRDYYDSKDHRSPNQKQNNYNHIT